MAKNWPLARLDRDGWRRVAGGAGAVLIAIVLYTRFTIDGALSRDESIYVYGGQQLAHGVAPYASIFDPKSPLATMLCGLGAGLANLFGVNDVHLIRLLFLGCSVLAVLACYLLVLQIWRSVLGGLVAAVVFASYEGFARDALAGPDAKTPGVLLALLSMWLAARRNWFWAAFAGSLAFLVWQPFLIFPLLPLLYAALGERERRLRAVGLAAGGAVLPVVAVLIYFASVGALGKFIESAFTFPLTGVQRRHQTFGRRLHHIVSVIHRDYAFSGVLFWIGAALLVLVVARSVVRGRADWRAALVDPVLVVVFAGALFEFGYALYDFQGYPDVFPLLPFPAIGIGAAIALAGEQPWPKLAARSLAGVVGAALAALTVLSAIWFDGLASNNSAFRAQQAAGCALQLAIEPGSPLYALGDPLPLVVTGRRNPDRFIFLDSGVAEWKVDHTSGGFGGWTGQLAAAHPSAVVMQSWTDRYVGRMWKYLVAHGYWRYWIGRLRVFLTPGAHDLAVANGVQPTSSGTAWPVHPGGASFTERSCDIG